MSSQIESFHLSVPEAQLTDLRRRLAWTRWPDRETVSGTSQGNCVPPTVAGTAIQQHRPLQRARTRRPLRPRTA